MKKFLFKNYKNILGVLLMYAPFTILIPCAFIFNWDVIAKILVITIPSAVTFILGILLFIES